MDPNIPAQPTQPTTPIVENPAPPNQVNQNVQPFANQPSNPSEPSIPESHENNIGKTLIAILLLLFIYPIGLIFMWIATKWPKWVKLLLTILPIILIIVGIIVVFSAALLGSRNTPTPNKLSLSVYQQATPKPTIAVNTEGNRIVNADGGYSFMLPSPWKAKISSYSNTTTIFGESFLNELGMGQIDVSSHDASLTDALSHQAKGQYSTPTPITIDGVSGVTENLISVAQGKVVIVYKDGKTYGISILSNNLDDLSKFQEILSSFKFTDQTSQIVATPIPDETANITSLVKDFYNKYLNGTPPARDTDLLMSQGYLTDNAVSLIKNAQMFDLPTCSQNPLSSGAYNYSAPKINGTLATIDVTGTYNGPPPTNITIGVSLMKLGAKWTIDAFHCPTPQ